VEPPSLRALLAEKEGALPPAEAVAFKESTERQVRDELADYTASNVEVLGVSVDSPYALKAWALQEGYKFPLLSDFWPHGAVAKTYGVFNEAAGLAVRGTFLIDTAGMVRLAEVNQPGQPRDQRGWKKAIAQLNT